MVAHQPPAQLGNMVTSVAKLGPSYVAIRPASCSQAICQSPPHTHTNGGLVRGPGLSEDDTSTQILDFMADKSARKVRLNAERTALLQPPKSSANGAISALFHAQRPATTKNKTKPPAECSYCRNLAGFQPSMYGLLHGRHEPVSDPSHN
ncbi:unnamed protein product [Protopolystoma xenopodis]|uniref:Uncharacterized protein n=1 Tax=Protopolystoma xenopodis TaxID=117903 RepID=A0A3S5AD79_9PLAT|nr:unnamed protein product [Protopolystoma xenopodis]